MTSWVVGDVHGCARELEQLLALLALGRDDGLFCVGDLFHRGPNPSGVLDLLEDQGARFVLGNHERAVLARAGLAPARADGSDRPALRTSFPPLLPDDLAGDSRQPLRVGAVRLERFMIFLQRHSGYFLESSAQHGAGSTRDGRPWCVVHAGRVPGQALAASTPTELTTLCRLKQRGGPLWFDAYGGPELVLFGHSVTSIPRAVRAHGRLVALGLDTGCVWGGRLTAYSPELDELRSVPAARSYAVR